MTGRSGAVSLSELVVVFWGFVLVLAALANFTHGQGQLARQQAGLLRLQEARRTTEIVLGRELRALAAADLRPSGAEELGLRAVRGSGTVCAASEDVVAIRYVGHRRPEPDKDSVVLIGAAWEEVRAIREVVGTACGEEGMTLTVDRSLPGPPFFAFVFEPGSYHAQGGALRYRLGRAGRQPLTEVLFGKTRFERVGGALHVRLEPHPDSVPAGLGSPLVIPLRRLNPDGP